MSSSGKKRDAKGGGRVLIIGLDGATFTVLDPLIERGFLPNLAAVVKRGMRGILRSTDPYVTAPAWTSLATGKRPDTHGVFDWSVPVPGRYRRQLVNDLWRRDQAFWEILADRGIPAGSINLPLTFPPSPRTSFCIADMFTPSESAEYTHPRSLKRELAGLGYRIDLRKSDYYQRGFDAFADDLIAMTRARGAAIRLCLERYPWRAAVAVFVGTDRIQHPFWHHLELDRPWGRDTFKAVTFFQALDEEVGRIVDQVGPDTHLYFVSDHGFGPHHRTFYVNEWLRAAGYLVLKEEPAPLWRARMVAHGAIRRLEDRARHLTGQLEARWPGEPGWAKQTQARLEDELTRLGTWIGEGITPGAPAVDWERTVAFADTPHGIQINLEGREPRGCVKPSDYDRIREEVAQALLEVVDPRTGEPVHREVVPREARYWGPRTDLAPDLVYTFTDGGSSWRIGQLETLRFGRRIGRSFLVADTAWETGTHRPEGILIAAGPDIRAGRAQQVHHLWDVVPTLLYHLEQPIPPDLDGLVMRELIREEVLAARPETWDGPAALRAGRGEGGTFGAQAEQAAVEDHLRALGYLS